MNDETPEDILEQWAKSRREQPVPSPSADFVDQAMSRIAEKTPSRFERFRGGLLKVAAVFVAGAVGFVRIEIVLQFLIHSL